LGYFILPHVETETAKMFHFSVQPCICTCSFKFYINELVASKLKQGGAIK